MKLWTKFSIVGALLISSMAAGSVTYKANGSIVPKGASEASYTWDLELLNSDKEVKIESKFYNKKSGKLETVETTSWLNKEFSQYEFKRLNSKEHGILKREGEKLTMTYIKGDSKDTTSFDADENLVAGPMVMLEIYKDWDELVAGKTKTINFAAIDHQRSVAFDLQLKEKSKDGYTFEMVPSSFLIAMFVDTLYFKYKSKEEIPAEIVGRVLPVDMEGSKIVPIDGSFVTSSSQVNLGNVVKF